MNWIDQWCEIFLCKQEIRQNVIFDPRKSLLYRALMGTTQIKNSAQSYFAWRNLFPFSCHFLLSRPFFYPVTESISRGQNTKLVSELRDNQTALLAANHNLMSLISNLTLANEISQEDHSNLTSLIGNLSRANDVLQNVTNNLTTQNNELRTEKTILETQREDLKEAIFQFEYFPVNAYCPIKENGQGKLHTNDMVNIYMANDNRIIIH